MKKTKIAFEDIRAGDLLEVTIVDCGVKSVVTGIAFEMEIVGSFEANHLWLTSEGGMIVAKSEESAVIHRIEILERLGE